LHRYLRGIAWERGSLVLCGWGNGIHTLHRSLPLCRGPRVLSARGIAAVSGPDDRPRLLTSEAACLAGELLACAMITWMRSLSSSMGRPATVDAVALYDCTVICEKAVLTPRGQQWSPGPDCSQDADLEALRKCKDGRPFCRGKPRHLPFSFVPPPWLASHEVLHSGFSALRHCAQWPLCAAASETPRPRIFPRCFWGRIRTFHGKFKEGNYTTSDGRCSTFLMASVGLRWPLIAAAGSL
jgi:hypothetical protein